MVPRRFLWLGLVVACGGGSGEGGAGGAGGAAGAGGSGGQPSLPPTWESPLDLSLLQGIEVSLSGDVSDPEGDAFTLSVLSPAGVEIALDGSGVDIHPGFVSSGLGLIELELTDATGSVSHPSLSADIAPLRWLDHEVFFDGPEPREHAAVLYDDGSQKAFVLQGSGYSPQGTALGDLWTYDQAAPVSPWLEQVPTGDVLQPAGSRRAAGSLAAGTALLYGGYDDGFTPLDELYRVALSGSTLEYTALTQVNPPPARSLHVFAHDPVSGRYVAFGGAGLTKPLGDTWLLEVTGDVATWTDLAPADAPSARYGAFFGVDLKNGRLLLFSGAQGYASINAADDTWALDLRADPPTWTLLDVPSAPPGRRNGCFVLDHRGPNLWVFGGTANGMTTEPGLWVLDGRPGKEAWHQLDLSGEPALRSSGFGFFDGANVFMGFGNDAAVYRDWAVLGHQP